MNNSSTSHKYEISFQGGRIVYQPLNGKITDITGKRTVILPEKRRIGIMMDLMEGKDPLITEFKPVCLTIYTSHRCNLQCQYCYVPDKDLYAETYADTAAVEAAARIVAQNCLERRLPFVLGFHGGNEPLLNQGKIEDLIRLCESVARKHDLALLPFCTTNGVIPEDTAKWAADRFQGITLSWDGPPEIHDKYRKDKLGRNTSTRVRKSAVILSELMASPRMLSVRCTITGTSLERVEEITDFFRKAGIKRVAFYPVFNNPEKSLRKELLPDPVRFVYSFLKARAYGDANGIEVSFSGSRITDYHGKYCMILQDNLTITQDGYLTNCFYHTQNYEKKYDQFFYGRFLPEQGKLGIDGEKLNRMKSVSVTLRNVCSDCFNQFHCSQGCPALCPFDENDPESGLPDCIKEKWLGLAAILERTGYLRKFESVVSFYDFFSGISVRRLS